jgi:hypothetical protein
MQAQSGTVGMEQAIYVNTNESLEISTLCSIGGNPNSNTPPIQGVSLNIDIRMLTTTSGLQYLSFSVVPTNDYLLNKYVIKVPEGFILDASVNAIGNYQANFPTWQQPYLIHPQIGQTWVRLMIVATDQPAQYTGTFLCQGYVTANQRICYPMIQPLSYDGLVAWHYIQNPVDYNNRGSYIIHSVQPNSVNELLGMQFQISTVNAGTARTYNLVACFQSTSLTNLPFLTLATISVPAFTLQAYSMVNYVSSGTIGGGGAVFLPLPAKLILPYGSLIQMLTSNWQSGDVVNQVSVLVKEWLVP